MAAPKAAHPHPWTLLFGPWSVGVGLTIVAGALFGALAFDPVSLGVDLCWFHRLSGGLPCPGCGLTRAVVAAARGDLLAAMRFHPFGPLVLGWAASAAVSPLLRGTPRRRVVAALGRSAEGFDRGYRALVAVFLGFGVARLVLTLANRVL